jgi:hypothetical protein
MPQSIPLDARGNPLAIGDTVKMTFAVLKTVKDGDRTLVTLQAIGGSGASAGMSPRLDAIEPGLVELVATGA